MLRSANFLCLAALSGVALAGVGPNTDFVIANKVINPDGHDRLASVVGTNDNDLQFPGPTLIGYKNQQFNINVINKLTEASMILTTSMHWHGIQQRKGTNWADGSAFVNQCPIKPGRSFQYQFTALNQAGTFWYHSHMSIQYCDGVRGAFIVYDPDDPYKSMYDFDDETTIITLADWYHDTYKGGLAPTPNSTIINGVGRYPGGPALPLAVVNVQQGKSYRFRIIAMSCESTFNFSIDGHTMTIIEADGEYTDPLEIDFIQIHAAQRYSVVVKADQAVDNYWIRADPTRKGVEGFDGNRNLAILRYANAPFQDPKPDPTVPITPTKPMNEVDLHSKFDTVPPGLPFPGAADVVITLDFAFDNQTTTFLINNATYKSPDLPVLLQILSGNRNAQDLLPKGLVYGLPANKSIEVRLPVVKNLIGNPHPFHLHGHAFYVVSSAGSAGSYNFVNPVRRDTVNTGNDSTTDQVAIRFQTDNTGPFFFHCHKEIHLEMGLGIIFAEDIEETSDIVKPPPDWYDLCK